MPATAATVRAALSDPSSAATTLLCAACSGLGTGPLLGRDGERWGPGALRDELAELAGGPLAPAQFDRLMAAVAVLTTDRHRRSAADFCTLCAGINGDGVAHDLWDPPSAEDAAWFLTEAELLPRLFHGRGGDAAYSAGVRRLVGEACRHEGLVDPPDVLRLGTHPARESGRRALTSYTDDPDTFAAIRGSQDARNAAILAELRGRMRLLLGQLAGLWRVAPEAAMSVIAAAE